MRFPFYITRGSTELTTARARRKAGKVERPVGLTAQFVLLLIAGYKVLLSPLLAGSCRFTPSCSDYMAGAVRQHGVWHGGLLGLGRLSRCRPLGPQGFDPVPDMTGRAVRDRQHGVKVR